MLFYNDHDDTERPAFAAVCARGDILTWDTAKRHVTPACEKCGSVILTACPECSEKLPGHDNRRDDVPYRADYCVHCAKPYPWRVSALKAAKRAVAMQADLDEWDAATKAYAEDFLSDVTDRTATKTTVENMERWFIQKGFSGSVDIVREIVVSLGADALKKALGLGPPA
jgi:hypothetical protein